METTKTHLSALVAVPPMDLWEPIQAIRKSRDRHFRDWMPHVTLLFPFRPREQFDGVAASLKDLGVGPFDITLEVLRYFRHYEWSHTIWLDPQPAEPWKHIHEGLLTRFPDCNDSARHENGFTPHLSVGQSRTPELADELQLDWKPLSWRVTELALVSRRDREPFEVVTKIPL